MHAADGWIHEGERADDLQRNGLRILQNPQKFCFGMDAVLLSDFAQARAGERVHRDRDRAAADEREDGGGAV